MKITLAKTEVQSLLAKALNLPADALSLTIKDLAVDINQGVESLSFGAVPVPVVTETAVAEETSEVVADEPKPKAKRKPAVKKEVVEEEIIEEEVVDDGDIDFL